MKKILCLTVAAIAALSSCSSDDIVTGEKDNGNIAKDAPVFTATIEGEAVTRTQLVEGSTAGELTKVAWLDTDKVYLYAYKSAATATDMESSVAGEYSVTPSSDDAAEATLKASSLAINNPEVSVNKVLAVYPASVAWLSTLKTELFSHLSVEDIVNYMKQITLPATQTYNGTDISAIAPMFAYSQGSTELSFKNLTALLAITVNASDFSSVQSIVVKSDKPMYDEFEVSTDGENKYTLSSLHTYGQDIYNVVTLDCKDNKGANTLIPAGGSKTFYVSIPPQTYGRLQIDVTDGTNTKTMRTRKADGILVERNNIYTIDFFEQAPPKLNIKVTSKDISSLKAIKVVTDQNIDGESNVKVYTIPEEKQNPADEGTVYSIAIPWQTYGYYQIYLSADGTAYKEAMATKSPDGLGEISTDIDIDYEKNAVQLWANGPYYATMNVGETTETGNTKHFKWGATTEGGDQNTGDYDLDHDTAYKIWGSAWRMPTRNEIFGFENNCVGSYSTSAPWGVTVTNKESGYGSIFLPVEEDSHENIGYAAYWSATPNNNAAYDMTLLCFGSTVNLKTGTDNGRDLSLYVRAVLR